MFYSCLHHNFESYFHFCFKKIKMAMHVIDVEKYLPTNTTATSIWSTQGAWTRETGNSRATYALGRLRSGTACASTYCTCMRSIGPTSVQCAARVLASRRAWTSICECTAANDRTSVFIAIRHSQRRAFCALIYVSTRAKSRSK